MFKLRQRRSIYSIVLLSLLVMFVAEFSVIIGIPAATGILRELDRNQEELLRQQTVYHESQLESAMGASWSNLEQVSQTINKEAEKLLARENLTMAELQKNPELKDELLLSVTDALITEMYIHRVNSIYIMLNTEDWEQLRSNGNTPSFSGLCIQDLDPLTTPAERYKDLRLKRAPLMVVRETTISTYADWRPKFVFGAEEDPANYDFLYQPFQTAYEAERVEDPSHFGYWTLAKSRWYGDETERFATYSQPLVLDDGTVYGVLGVELMEEYLTALLPHDELLLNGEGTYALAKVGRTETGEIELKEILISGTSLTADDIGRGTLLAAGEGFAHCRINGEKYYIAVQPVSVYDSSTPYQEESWKVCAIVKEGELYRISRRTEYTLGVATLLMLLIGLAGSVLIARRLSKPVQKLSDEVNRAQQTLQDGIPKLTKTNVKEYDQFSEAFTALSEDLVNTSSRFLRIIEMASSEIGGFEACPGEDVFITANFFSMLGKDMPTNEPMSLEKILALRERLKATVPWTQWHDGSEIFELVDKRGHTRYIQVSAQEQDGAMLGLAEDVTALMAERKRIEYERDHDLLTGLVNRRAFYREVDRIFHSDAKGVCGAVVMMDLDDLKKINDKFGHEWGDQYLRKAAWGFHDAMPSNAILARLAGDEFAAVFYGYDDEAEARGVLREFEKKIYQNTFVDPDDKVHPVRVSGGIAWYPKDGTNLQELMKYADFALYQVKKGGRGKVTDFDFATYNQALYHAQNRQELYKLIEEKSVDYHFQSIFSARDGKVFAYEALMRVKMQTLHSPVAVLNLARQENRLKDIERITMERATEIFADLRRQGRVNEDAYLFLNSIADQYLEEEEQLRVEENCRDFADKVVIEITEHNETDAEVLEKKRKMPWFSGLLALDDYGTGYNGEKNLLEIAPKFVKLDICLVRGIDFDVNKQQIVSNLLTFAHQRDMMVIAEGLETMGEVRKAVELGVDLLQGFALARPNCYPQEISETALQMISEVNEKRSEE